MKVADLLSDLTQLQFADPEAALALVSARSSTPGDTAVSGDASSNGYRDDPDLKRAKDLLDLHKTVKLAHPDAEPDAALKKARADVDKVLREL
ncbi:hypothetical protein CERZMDRAFT_30454 [Cercospora zeae-maydis SCOH1-5]|uniref:Uncharacterized protein n=1 Tax=Cercospora zeae-maydis SCOH1-5 TaxID=717836 RepID=A0A6A6FX50_9PEZI|nr:hypothetical protein CERZMDRAFT_30454 [Cercospora zeae-maydis SCOH1-5]